jgi:CheY-like chemotaxis protein
VKGRYTRMVEQLVLIVDGDISMRGIVGEVLQDAGYTIVEAEYAEQALVLARQHSPAAILVNHLLPDAFGPDLIRQFRDEPATRDIPTILLSGCFHQLTDHDVADRVVSLPFDIDVLQREIEAVVGTAATTVA